MAGEWTDELREICLQQTVADPVEILEQLAPLMGGRMHGPEHHVMVGAALLTAYRNAGGQIDLPAALDLMIARGKQVPGAACGNWGACGAGISSGMFVSIATGASNFTQEEFGLANRMTAQSLSAIGTVGGPRCCKRDSYLAMREAVAFARENLGVEMVKRPIVCSRSAQNAHCIKDRCPFFAGAEAE